MLKTPEYEMTRLRRNGMSISNIATSVSLPLGTVKAFLHRNNVKPYTEGYCKQCGKKLEYVEHKRKKEFCSTNCRVNWRNKNSTFTFTCKHCNKTFTRTRNDHPRYCSHECYISDRFGGNKNEHS